jgi:AraC-like DNA-binding protein
MDDIDKLLLMLNSMYPISDDFKLDIRPMLPGRYKKHNHRFLKAGSVAKTAWQLLSGYVIVVGKDANGKKAVKGIVCPGEIFTDLNSFFYKDIKITYDYFAIGKVKVLELQKSDFVKLYQYPETNQLVNKVMLHWGATEAIKVDMIALPYPQRIINFYAHYQVPGLADRYIACFLRIPFLEFIELKVALQHSGTLTLVQKTIKGTSTKTSIEKAYEVKAYLTQNYTRKGIGKLDTLTKTFNITKKTLTIWFKKAAGMTVPQFITKLRMDKAKDLLAEGNRTVTEVCEAVGYENAYNFSRKFKGFHGFPPKETVWKDH